MDYPVIASKQFTKRFEQLEKALPRISKLKSDLFEKLSKKPFDVGYPLPKQKHWKYGFYYFAKSNEFGSFPSFRIVYRITDDKVEVLDMSPIKF